MEYTVKTKGVEYTAYIDDIDSDLLDVKWFRHKDKATDSAYMNRNIDGVTYIMHRVIMERVLGRNLERHELVGHKDLNGLNNRRENLYIGDKHTIGLRRRLASKVGKSGLLSGTKRHGSRYQAQIKLNGKVRYLGTFDTVEEAHKAYVMAREASRIVANDAR